MAQLVAEPRAPRLLMPGLRVCSGSSVTGRWRYITNRVPSEQSTQAGLSTEVAMLSCLGEGRRDCCRGLPRLNGPRSVLARHLVLSSSANRGRQQIASANLKTSVREMDAYDSTECWLLNSLIGS